MKPSDIDKTFVINLPDCIERRKTVSKELSLHGLSFSIWDAVRNDDGAKGLIETMKQLFEYCIKTGLNNILVLEDDVVLVNRSLSLLYWSLDKLPEDYHLFYLGGNILFPPEKMTDSLMLIRGMYATHAVIYSAASIQLILKLLKKDIHLAYDQILLQNIQNLGKSYCSYPMIANQRKGKSDIFVYNPQLHRGMGRYYNVETEEIDWGLMMDDRFTQMTKNIMQ